MVEYYEERTTEWLAHPNQLGQQYTKRLLQPWFKWSLVQLSLAPDGGARFVDTQNAREGFVEADIEISKGKLRGQQLHCQKLG